MRTIRNRYMKLKRNEVCPCDENMALDEGKRKRFKKCCGLKLAAKEQAGITKVNVLKKIKELKNEAITRHQHKLDHPLILPNTLDKDGNKKVKIIIP